MGLVQMINFTYQHVANRRLAIRNRAADKEAKEEAKASLYQAPSSRPNEPIISDNSITTERQNTSQFNNIQTIN